MSAEDPKTRTGGTWSHPWVGALTFFVAYVGISVAVHVITGKGLSSDFITEHLVGGVVASAVYTVLTQWWARRRSN